MSLLGRFDPGWKYYEARFKACKEFEALHPPSSGLRVKSFGQLPQSGQPGWSSGASKDWVTPSSLFVIFICLNLQVFLFLFVARDSLFNLLSKWTGLSDHIIRSTALDAATEQRPHVPLLESADALQY